MSVAVGETLMLRSFLAFTRVLIEQRYLIRDMAKRQIASKYVGSLLGLLWMIIHPMVLITVFWFVFSFGFRVTPNNDVPFVVWLTAGLAPWYFFAQIVPATAGSIVAHTNLVKKTLFPSEILPIVNIISSMVSHLVFLVLLIILILLQQLGFSFYILQFLYYLFCLCMLMLGIGWIVSALNVFFRDIGPIIGLVIQVGFWATPIFWNLGMMPPKVQAILKLNPMFYIVQGYRNSFVYHIGFWETPYLTLYFWSVTILLLAVGITIFQRLKPQFADVL